jgi:hypothetical protein
MGKTIHIKELKNGMILASSIINKYGQVLLKKETEINDVNKNVLELWGVQYLEIVDDFENYEDYINEELYLLAKLKLDAYLLWTPETELELDLYNTAIRHIAHKFL